MVQFDLDRLTIEIFVKIEKMGLEQFFRRIETRPDAKIGRTFQNPSVGQSALHRIYSVFRAQIMADVDIGGGIAEQPAIFVAVDDFTLDRKGPGEQPIGFLALSFLQRLADAARRDDVVAVPDGDDRFAFQSVGQAKSAQQIDIALRALAEGEVRSGHHARGAKAVDQQPGDKILCRGSRQRSVKFEHQHRTCSGIGEQALTLVQRRQPERRQIGLEKPHRVGIKGCDDGRPALFPRPAQRLAGNRLMAKVKTVKIAQRDYSTAQVALDPLFSVQSDHRIAIAGFFACFNKLVMPAQAGT